jgi:uncharacterized Zn-binding protein involved in type VI secretion
MAVRYAVATGNWSDTATWNGGTLPTSADDVYSNGFTVTIDQDINVTTLRNTAQSPAIAGGGFVVSSSVTIDLTADSGLIGVGNFHVLTWNGGAGVTTNINANNIDLFNSSFVALNVAGEGTLNLNSNIRHNLFNNPNTTVLVSGNCTFNIVGYLIAVVGGSSSSGGSIVRITGTATINFTGDFQGNGLAAGFRIQNAANVNITGNLSSISQKYGIVCTSNATINVTGNIIGRFFQGTSTNHYLKIVGIIQASSFTCIESRSSGAINIFTGPFICFETGVFPLDVFLMHYFRTLNSYFEFRDETTNGALPPSTPAPATRLVSPDTAVDAPVPANVRHGVSYALGTFTGTLKVPSPDSVAKGVPTDNTVGNAVLTPDAVWDYATANLTDPNSIGARLKNVSTVDTTGEQLEALL